jgi:glutathione S-transferase
MHLYSAPLSLFARKVEIALAEKGLAFTRTMVAFTQTRGYSPKHAAVLAANPKGQVPVLIDGDVTLYDSTVIVEYLEDAYPEPSLYPKGAADRARCRLLELEADEVMLTPVRTLMFRTEPPGADQAQRQRQEAEARKAEPSIDSHHWRLDEKLAGTEFLCGTFSAADIATFMVVHYALRLGAPRIGHLANLSRWYQSLTQRPAFAAAMAEIAAADRALSHPVVLPPEVKP